MLFSKFQSVDFSGNVKSCHHLVYQNFCVFKSSLWREPQPDSPPPHWYADQLRPKWDETWPILPATRSVRRRRRKRSRRRKRRRRRRNVFPPVTGK